MHNIISICIYRHKKVRYQNPNPQFFSLHEHISSASFFFFLGNPTYRSNKCGMHETCKLPIVHASVGTKMFWVGVWVRRFLSVNAALTYGASSLKNKENKNKNKIIKKREIIYMKVKLTAYYHYKLLLTNDKNEP